MPTLQEYLQANLDKGFQTHTLTAVRNGGKVGFYLHPSNVDGDTLDFEVQDDLLIAGSVFAGPSEASAASEGPEVTTTQPSPSTDGGWFVDPGEVDKVDAQ